MSAIENEMWKQTRNGFAWIGRLSGFWGKEILKNTDECIRVIEETVFEKQMKNPDDTQHKYSDWL